MKRILAINSQYVDIKISLVIRQLLQQILKILWRDHLQHAHTASTQHMLKTAHTICEGALVLHVEYLRYWDHPRKQNHIIGFF